MGSMPSGWQYAMQFNSRPPRTSSPPPRPCSTAAPGSTSGRSPYYSRPSPARWRSTACSSSQSWCMPDRTARLARLNRRKRRPASRMAIRVDCGDVGASVIVTAARRRANAGHREETMAQSINLVSRPRADRGAAGRVVAAVRTTTVQSRPRSSQDPGRVRHRGTSKGAKMRGRVPGIQVCLNHLPGRFLFDGVTNKSGQLPQNHAETSA